MGNLFGGCVPAAAAPSRQQEEQHVVVLQPQQHRKPHKYSEPQTPMTFEFRPELGADIMKSLLECEVEYEMDVPDRWLRFRRVLIDWISEYADEHEVSIMTNQMCISMLDRIAAKVEVKQEKLQNTAVACMQLAIKYGEREQAVPSLRDINGYHPDLNFTVADMLHYELSVLKLLDWKVRVPTSAHFVSHWVAQGVVYEDDVMAGRPCPAKAIKYVRRYAEFFSELCLQKYSFRKYKESMLGAAYVYCGRKAVCLLPPWHEHLCLITTYSEEDLAGCVEDVWAFYLKNFPNSKPVINKESE